MPGKRSKTRLAKLNMHKHLRDMSPEERALPKHFSVKRDVAYLFDSDQPKFGSYRNAKVLNEEWESQHVSKFVRSKSTLDRVKHLYQTGQCRKIYE